MGIQGLLNILDSIKIPVELEDFSGKRIAVDGHVWIFNAMGIYKFRVKRGTTNPLFINYLKNRLDELKEHNITPIIVFDGQKVPIKRLCYSKREQKYTKPPEEQHNTTPSAWETYELVNQSVKVLKERNIQYIIAPFEADPQLTYLSITDQVDAVLSADSDLLVFGCKQVIYKNKKDYYTIRQSDIYTIQQEQEPENLSKTLINFTTFDQTRFRHLCILSGCDYLDNFKQVRLKRVLKLMYKSQDVQEIIRQLCDKTKESKTGVIDELDYLERFENANAGFLYQYVFDPRSRLYMRLNPLPPGKLMFDMDLLGESPRIKNIPMHQFNDAIDVDKIDLDGLEQLFEALHIEPPSPSLSSDLSTLTDGNEKDDEIEKQEIIKTDIIEIKDDDDDDDDDDDIITTKETVMIKKESMFQRFWTLLLSNTTV